MVELLSILGRQFRKGDFTSLRIASDESLSTLGDAVELILVEDKAFAFHVVDDK